MLPEIVSLVLDDWSSETDHYVEIFAKYDAKNDDGYENVLLAFLIIKISENRREKFYLVFTEYVLSVHAKSYCNVVAFLKDK